MADTNHHDHVAQEAVSFRGKAQRVMRLIFEPSSVRLYMSPAGSRIEFTFVWTEAQRGEGRNFSTLVVERA